MDTLPTTLFRWRTEPLRAIALQEFGCTCDSCLIVASEIHMKNLLPNADTCWEAFKALHMQGVIDPGGLTEKAFMAGMYTVFGLLEVLSKYDGEPVLERLAVTELEEIRKDVEQRLTPTERRRP